MKNLLLSTPAIRPHLRFSQTLSALTLMISLMCSGCQLVAPLSDSNLTQSPEEAAQNQRHNNFLHETYSNIVSELGHYFALGYNQFAIVGNTPEETDSSSSASSSSSSSFSAPDTPERMRASTAGGGSSGDGSNDTATPSIPYVLALSPEQALARALNQQGAAVCTHKPNCSTSAIALHTSLTTGSDYVLIELFAPELTLQRLYSPEPKARALGPMSIYGTRARLSPDALPAHAAQSLLKSAAIVPDSSADTKAHPSQRRGNRQQRKAPEYSATIKIPAVTSPSTVASTSAPATSAIQSSASTEKAARAPAAAAAAGADAIDKQEMKVTPSESSDKAKDKRTLSTPEGLMLQFAQKPAQEKGPTQDQAESGLEQLSALIPELAAALQNPIAPKDEAEASSTSTTSASTSASSTTAVLSSAVSAQDEHLSKAERASTAQRSSALVLTSAGHGIRPKLSAPSLDPISIPELTPTFAPNSNLALSKLHELSARSESSLTYLIELNLKERYSFASTLTSPLYQSTTPAWRYTSKNAS